MTNATSLRVYLQITDEQQVHDAAEAIANALVKLGFNSDNQATAMIACMTEGEDMEAWATGRTEEFVAAMADSAFLVIPDPSG